MDIGRLISKRANSIDASGIRRVFELGAKLKNPINLSIGQPDFPVPDAVKNAAIAAIEGNRNGYTLTTGIPELLARVRSRIADDVGWDMARADSDAFVTSGTSSGLALAFEAMLNEGDEVIIPDPYFVAYPHLATLCGARAVKCDTYPDFVMTAERVEPLITPRTKCVLFNSPSNPCGSVAAQKQCADLLDLCRRRGVLLISDEIYDEFTYSDSRTGKTRGGKPACPSPAREPGAQDEVLLIRGFGKTYGVTGWRLGFAAGPKQLIQSMAKVHQYSFVCAPAPLQWGAMATFDVDIGPTVAAYEKRRDLVLRALREVTDVATPGGAFYAFPRVPDRLRMTASEFCAKAVEHELLIIPGSVFSARDTNFRLSYAVSGDVLTRGLDVIKRMMSS